MTFPSPTSSPGRAFLVATIDYFENDGDDETNADWWNMIKKTDVFTSGWTESYETHTGGCGEYTTGYVGDAHLTVSYCQSPGVEHFTQKTTHSTSITLQNYFPADRVYWDSCKDVDAAEAFIEYLLSTEINRNMPENNLMYSVLKVKTYQKLTATDTMQASQSRIRILKSLG